MVCRVCWKCCWISLEFCTRSGALALAAAAAVTGDVPLCVRGMACCGCCCCVGVVRCCCCAMTCCCVGVDRWEETTGMGDIRRSKGGGLLEPTPETERKDVEVEKFHIISCDISV